MMHIFIALLICLHTLLLEAYQTDNLPLKAYQHLVSEVASENRFNQQRKKTTSSSKKEIFLPQKSLKIACLQHVARKKGSPD